MSYSPSELYQWLLRDGKEPPPIVIQTDPGDSVETTVIHEEAVASYVDRRNVFRHPHAHPIVLDLLLLQKYGEQWFGWEIETVERRVPTDFGVDRISDINVSKLQAMRTLHLVDDFWKRWEVFTWVAMPLNGVFPDFHVMQVPSVLDCMIAVDIATRVQSDVEWSEEIKHFLAAVHIQEGIVVPQTPLRFVSLPTTMEEPSHPVVETRHGVKLDDLVRGTPIEHFCVAHYPVDAAYVGEQWAHVRASQRPPSEDTPEAEQLRRMLHLHNRLMYQREQLRLQLGMLHD